MAEFRKTGGFGGGDRGNRGGFGGGRPSFGNKPRFGGKPHFKKFGDRNDGPKEMFKATCAQCGKSCEVPFRPNGQKPVYCNECFGGKRDDAPRGDYQRPETRAEPAMRPEFKSMKNDEMKKQFEILSSKMDKIIAMLSVNIVPVPVEAPAEVVTEKVEKKATRKKVSKKK